MGAQCWESVQSYDQEVSQALKSQMIDTWGWHPYWYSLVAHGLLFSRQAFRRAIFLFSITHLRLSSCKKTSCGPTEPTWVRSTATYIWIPLLGPAHLCRRITRPEGIRPLQSGFLADTLSRGWTSRDLYGGTSQAESRQRHQGICASSRECNMPTVPPGAAAAYVKLGQLPHIVTPHRSRLSIRRNLRR